jgi:hypothetical protein
VKGGKLLFPQLKTRIGSFCTPSAPAHAVTRSAYAAGVGSLTATGAVLFMFAFAPRLPWSLVGTGVTPGEMRDRFAPWFDPVGRIRGSRPRGAAWYRLRRR